MDKALSGCLPPRLDPPPPPHRGGTKAVPALKKCPPPPRLHPPPPPPISQKRLDPGLYGLYTNFSVIFGEFTTCPWTCHFCHLSACVAPGICKRIFDPRQVPNMPTAPAMHPLMFPLPLLVRCPGRLPPALRTAAVAKCKPPPPSPRLWRAKVFERSQPSYKTI